MPLVGSTSTACMMVVSNVGDPNAISRVFFEEIEAVVVMDTSDSIWHWFFMSLFIAFSFSYLFPNF